MIVCCRLPKLEMPRGPPAGASRRCLEIKHIPEVVSCGALHTEPHLG